MSVSRVSYAISVIYGIFILSFAVRAIFVATRLSGGMINDCATFGFIIVTLLLSLFLLLPHKTLPFVRGLAERYGKGPVQFSFAILVFVPLMVGMLSGIVPIWLNLTMGALFFMNFVAPAFALFGIKKISPDALSGPELRELITQKLKTHPKLRIFHIANCAMIVGACLAVLFMPEVISTSNWKNASGWLGFFGAAMTTTALFLPSVLWMPQEARQKTIPGFIAFSAILLVFLTLAYRTALIRSLPISMASIAGQDVSNGYVVLSVKPHTNRKYCRGSLRIQTSSGSQKLCNLSQEFLKSLSPGQTIAITGKETAFGQTIETLHLEQ